MWEWGEICGFLKKGGSHTIKKRNRNCPSKSSIKPQNDSLLHFGGLVIAGIKINLLISTSGKWTMKLPFESIRQGKVVFTVLTSIAKQIPHCLACEAGSRLAHDSWACEPSLLSRVSSGPIESLLLSDKIVVNPLNSIWFHKRPARFRLEWRPVACFCRRDQELRHEIERWSGRKMTSPLYWKVAV